MQLSLGSSATTMPGCSHWHSRSSYFERQTDREGGESSSPPRLLLNHLSPGQVRHVSAREDAGRPEESRSTVLNHCRGLLLCDGSASFSRSKRRTGRQDLRPASYKSTKRLPAARAVGFSIHTHFYCHPEH